MANKVIKEHYVPQRYLKHFANNKKRFHVFDKEKLQQRPGNIADYACERYFYDVDFDELKKDILIENPNYEFDPEIEEAINMIDEQHIEHWFAQNVETWLFDPLDRIISLYTICNPQKLNTIEILNQSDISCLSLYIALQVMRAKEFRENIAELYERIPLLLMKKFAKTEEEKEQINAIRAEIRGENYKKLLHAQFLTNQEALTDFAATFAEKLWMIGYNKTDVLFYTSDNPIVRYGHQGEHGFNSRGIEILFPINTKLILILKDPSFYSSELGFHNHFIELSREEVVFYNSLQVQQSYRCIFDKDGDFSLANRITKKYPELKNIKRKRFLMG